MRIEVIIGFVMIGMLMAAAMSILFAVFYTRKNGLIRDKLELELVTQKRMYELELNALRSQLNPHFVHNSLNAILYYIQKNDVEMSEKYLGLFAKLMRQFFNFSNQKEVSLDDELDLIRNYMELEKMRFEDQLTYTIEVEDRLRLMDTYIPSLMIQPILENAIKHGIFPNGGKGEINLSFRCDEQAGFIVRVVDNGIGINKSITGKQPFVRNHRKSSTVLRDRVELLNQSGEWKISYDILDRSGEQPPSTGTEVVIYFREPR